MRLLALLLMTCLALGAQEERRRAATTTAAAGGSPCATEQQAEGDTGNFDGAQDWTGFRWKANSFTTGGSGFTVCKAQAYLAKQGTPAAGTLEALIYTDSSGTPGTLVGTGSATLDRTTISGTQAFVEFTGMSAVLSASTTYWFILKASALDTDSGNRIYWQEDVTGETNTGKDSADGSAWESPQTTRAWLFKLFSN